MQRFKTRVSQTLFIRSPTRSFRKRALSRSLSLASDALAMRNRSERFLCEEMPTACVYNCETESIFCLLTFTLRLRTLPAIFRGTGKRFHVALCKCWKMVSMFLMQPDGRRCRQHDISTLLWLLMAVLLFAWPSKQCI